jgi:outer membrane protein OmpA-like peptidoglycan-associated protein
MGKFSPTSLQQIRVKSEDVDEVLPNTMKKAEGEYAKAVSLWKDAGKEKSVEKATAMKGEATKMAGAVAEVTSGATELKQNIVSWDDEFSVLEGQYSIPSLLGQIRVLREDLVRGKETISSPFAKISSLKFQGPVAYFDTDQAALDSYYIPAITEVVALLNLDPNLVVSISGYADIRGPELYNEELSKKRAEAVAEILKSNGIAEDRLTISPMGAKLAHFKTGLHKLQLERRVDLTVTVKPAVGASH